MDLAELRERVRAATGPDRELDFALKRLWSDIAARLTFKEAIEAPGFTLPPYTASVDAALALVERMLPGWAYNLQVIRDVTTRTEQDAVADFWLPSIRTKHLHRERFRANAQTLPLAILLALLDALLDSDRGKPNGE